MKRLLVIAVLLGAPAIASAQDMHPRPTMSVPAMTAEPVARPTPAPAMVRPKATASVKAPTRAPADGPMVTPMAKPKKAVAPPIAASTGRKKSKLETATKWIEWAGGFLVSLLTLLAGILTAIKGADWRKGIRGKRWDKIQYYANKAFNTVEGIAGMTNWKGDDKLVEYLKRINLWLRGEGKKPLTDDEKEAVKLAASDRAATKKVGD